MISESTHIYGIPLNSLATAALTTSCLFWKVKHSKSAQSTSPWNVSHELWFQVSLLTSALPGYSLLRLWESSMPCSHTSSAYAPSLLSNTISFSIWICPYTVPYVLTICQPTDASWTSSQNETKKQVGLFFHPKRQIICPDIKCIKLSYFINLK